jgi:hypothetical protein
MLDEMLAESGGPLTDRERVAADAALPSSPSLSSYPQAA